LVAAWLTPQQTMTTDAPSIPVGVDGETAELDTPLEFTVCPRALRLLQPPRNEPVDAVLAAVVISKNSLPKCVVVVAPARCAAAGVR
jgi:hypothetical protein